MTLKLGNWSGGKNGNVVISDSPTGHDNPSDIAYYGGHLVAESVPEHLVNLIAAAPDLLVAAHDVLAWADEQGIETENGEFHDLQAAVLKAMGETND